MTVDDYVYFKASNAMDMFGKIVYILEADDFHSRRAVVLFHPEEVRIIAMTLLEPAEPVIVAMGH